MAILAIDLTELASSVADDLQITDTDLADLKEGSSVPNDWTNAIMDRLQVDYNIEDLIIGELVRVKK